MLTALLWGAVAVQQERYTYKQVEAMLKRYLHRREEIDLRGGWNYRRLIEEPPSDDLYRRAAVSDAVAERADLFRALAQIHHHHRAIIVLWYATDWSPQKIALWYAKQGLDRVSERTIFRWRRLAVETLVRQMNRNR